MPRYFTHHHGAEVLHDDQGEQFDSLAAAILGARQSASELIAEQIAAGYTVDLSNTLVVTDEAGETLFVLRYSDLFRGSGTAPSVT